MSLHCENLEMSKAVILLSLVSLVFASSDVRLVNRDGSYNTQVGRVEVYLHNKWGQVCGDGFGSVDAGVVCSSLGYTGYGSVETANHGIGNLSIVIGNVVCNGQETSLLNCQYREQDTCITGIAGVDCETSLDATGSVGLEAGVIAAIVICLVAIVGILILLGACLWRNDFCVGGGAAA